MKKIAAMLLCILMIAVMLPCTAFAAEGDPTFLFDLTVDGKYEKNADTGDVITVTFVLRRTDSDEAYTMYAMQDEIKYDSSFFELVEGSVMVQNQITTTDLALRDSYRKLYMNYLSLGGGEQWQSRVTIGSFQLKVIGTKGVSAISNENAIVSLQDGSAGYAAEAKDITVIVTTDCTVHFETNGGSAIDDATAQYGEKLDRPNDPTKDGLYFAGWYKDIDLGEKWDFENDLVSGNMTLYAAWSETPVETDLPASSGTTSSAIWIILAAVAAAAVIVVMRKKKGGDKGEKNKI